jgi:DNA invertase Pin-like site-specific DNA recombinase
MMGMPSASNHPTNETHMRCTINHSHNSSPKRGRPPLNAATVKQIRTGRVMGFTLQQIAQVLGLSLMTVWKYAQPIPHKNRPNRFVCIHRRSGALWK